MKAFFLGTLALAALIGTSAMAADLPVKTPVYKAPPPAAAAVFSWTGFYIGIHGGGDWIDNDWFLPASSANVTNGCVALGCPAAAGSHSASNWLAGGQVGFNYQTGWWVWGVEAQASWTKLEGANVNVNPFFAALGILNHSKTDSLGTIAGRLGVAWGQTLLYAKGGGAWAHDTFWTSTPGIPIGQSLTETRWGWMVGVGAEYAFLDSWSVKIEYDYMDFGRRRETLATVTPGFLPVDYDIRQTIQLVKVGLNYRFGYTPVIAKY